jgi:hypothetical protein
MTQKNKEKLEHHLLALLYRVEDIMFDLNIVKNDEIEYKKLDEFIKSLQLYLQKNKQ